MKNLFLFCLLFLYSPLMANDASGYILPAGGIAFIKQDGIKMLVEALYIKEGQVEVNYLFENTTDKDIVTQVFFPLPSMPALDSYYDLGGKSRHRFNFFVSVNGQTQPYKTVFSITQKGKNITPELSGLFKNAEDNISESDLDDYVTGLPDAQRDLLVQKNLITYSGLMKVRKDGQVDDIAGWAPVEEWKKEVSFYWTQTFPAAKTLWIRHTYTPSAIANNMGHPYSSCVSPDSTEVETFRFYSEAPNLSTNDWQNRYQLRNFMQYVLVTANHWQGPIEHFNLLAEGPLKVMGCFEDKPFFSLGRFYARNLQDFAPTSDLSLDFATLYNYKDVSKNKPTLYRIDGPANVREKPRNGKIVAQLADGSYAWVLEKEGKKGWYPVIQNDITGYTYKDNLVAVFKK